MSEPAPQAWRKGQSAVHLRAEASAEKQALVPAVAAAPKKPGRPAEGQVGRLTAVASRGVGVERLRQEYAGSSSAVGLTGELASAVGVLISMWAQLSKCWGFFTFVDTEDHRSTHLPGFTDEGTIIFHWSRTFFCFVFFPNDTQLFFRATILTTLLTSLGSRNSTKHGPVAWLRAKSLSVN
ncbi:hypothetical protein [Cystobacter ferrugineus]|uniref:Uncharacterized protein n=1 Tax=Cystobacter ferrugineus TaxID=83449 RepID=A0A1L9BFG1_9BACT|nr:hypothetical protein [Cystobacter ferrugineus]OJH40987.1 hypothetical protein BON30_08745 [Cystobacter ferrugineus]